MARGLSSCGSRALERRLSSFGAWAQLLRGMWGLPGPGLEPMSPALAGGFLTTAPPRKIPMFEYAFNNYFFLEKAHDLLYLYLNNNRFYQTEETLAERWDWRVAIEALK